MGESEAAGLLTQKDGAPLERGDGDFGDPVTTRLWVTASILALLAFYTAAAVYFRYAEGWHWIDSFYFAVVTLTTVGYGQFVPTHIVSRIGTTVFIIIGVFVSAVVVATIQQSVIHTLSERNSLGQSRWRELLAPTFLVVVLTASYSAWVHYYDGMEWDKSFYFVIVSFSSVGYGDVLLKDRFSRLFGIFFLLLGCAAWTYLMTSMLTVIVTRFQLHHMKAPPPCALLAIGVAGRVVRSNDVRANYHCVLAGLLPGEDHAREVDEDGLQRNRGCEPG